MQDKPTLIIKCKGESYSATLVNLDDKSYVDQEIGKRPKDAAKYVEFVLKCFGCELDLVIPDDIRQIMPDYIPLMGLFLHHKNNT